MFNKWKVIYHIHESDLGKAAEFAITVHGKGETGPSLTQAVEQARELFGTPFLVNLKTGKIKPVVPK
jgi:hypothetical protein